MKSWSGMAGVWSILGILLLISPVLAIGSTSAWGGSPFAAQVRASSPTRLWLPLIVRGSPSPTPTPGPSPATYALRFYGTGSGDIDRVKIPVVSATGTSLPVNVGATDFTLEFWVRFVSGENVSGPCQEGEDTWIYGNIIIDRDIFGVPDYGDFGISLYGGRVAFGVHNGSYGHTICSTATLAPQQWHHVAVTRRTNGEMRIFINGSLSRSAAGPAGSIAYRAGRTPGWPNEPYLVIGAEKHDYDPTTYPSFSGWVDEVRISNMIRYTADFTPPQAPFVADSATVGLYHFDEGTGTVVLDSSTGASHGERRVGGPQQGPVYDAVTKRF